MIRIGQSSDIHRLVKGRDLYLGGVKIESELGLLGHSDADALLHAIIEAIIGAMGLGDIGKHFSDEDAAYKDISSLILLERTYEMMKREGYEIGNIDALIMIEKPKMAPHIFKMRENVAKALHCVLGRVNIKATRGEGLGFVGRSEGVLAQAVVLLNCKEVL